MTADDVFDVFALESEDLLACLEETSNDGSSSDKGIVISNEEIVFVLARDEVFELLSLEPEELLACFEEAPDDGSACGNLSIVISSEKIAVLARVGSVFGTLSTNDSLTIRAPPTRHEVW